MKKNLQKLQRLSCQKIIKDPVKIFRVQPGQQVPDPIDSNPQHCVPDINPQAPRIGKDPDSRHWQKQRNIANRIR